MLKKVHAMLSLAACSLLLARVGHAQPVTKYRLEKLITDLNTSADLNRVAREELIALGKEAVPRLLEEVQKYRRALGPSRTAAAARDRATATRALRVLADMKSDAALSLVTRAIGDMEISAGEMASRQRTDSERWKCVLANEMLAYLYDHFADENVRDVYVRFVAGILAKYSDGQYGLFRWRTCRLRYEDHVHIGLDFLRGFPLMIEHEDERVGDLLILLLRTMPYEICDGQGSKEGVGQVLSPDGFGPQRLDLSERGLEAKGRIRIWCMQMIKEIGGAKAIDAIEPLLKSENDDERQTALEVIVALKSGGQVSPADPESDLVRLRKGETVRCTLMDTEIIIKTPYARLLLPIAGVARIKLGAAGQDTVELHAGDRLMGRVENTEFLVGRKDGARAKIPRASIAGITVLKREQ
jgi:hypothetical protein